MEGNKRINWNTVVFDIPMTVIITYNEYFEDTIIIVSLEFGTLTLYSSCFPKQILDRAKEEVLKHEKESNIIKMASNFIEQPSTSTTLL